MPQSPHDSLDLQPTVEVVHPTSREALRADPCPIVLDSSDFFPVVHRVTIQEDRAQCPWCAPYGSAQSTKWKRTDQSSFTQGLFSLAMGSHPELVTDWRLLTFPKLQRKAGNKDKEILLLDFCVLPLNKIGVRAEVNGGVGHFHPGFLKMRRSSV